jgi:peptidoglycan/LPS O-acetylase OafA/YrhL
MREQDTHPRRTHAGSGLEGNPYPPSVNAQEADLRPSSQRRHIPFLDGLRGVSALYVVVFHVIAGGKEEISRPPAIMDLFRFGHEAVVVFIVLSGFVLALPLARSANPRFSGGIPRFVARRARRILPGYYAALLLVPIYIVAIEVSKGFTGEGANWGRIKDLFLGGDMLSHLFLIHNIKSAWAGSINPVLWSMGTEWWIYFVFALLLVPIWRRFGVGAAFFWSIGLGVIPAVLAVCNLPTLYGSPHLLMGFGAGIVSAVFVCSDSEYRRHDALVTMLILLSTLGFFLVVVFDPSLRLGLRTRFITDLALAVACAGSLIKLSFAGERDRLAWGAKRVLELKPIVLLGGFSYSLYLTHLAVLNIIGTTLHLAPIKAFVKVSLDPLPTRLFVLIPLLVLFAYGFYLLFERPFLRQRPASVSTKAE